MDSDEAEAEWEAAWKDPNVQREKDSKNRDTLAVDEFVKYRGKIGHKKESMLQRKSVVPVSGHAQAERRVSGSFDMPKFGTSFPTLAEFMAFMAAQLNEIVTNYAPDLL